MCVSRLVRMLVCAFARAVVGGSCVGMFAQVTWRRVARLLSKRIHGWISVLTDKSRARVFPAILQLARLAAAFPLDT